MTSFLEQLNDKRSGKAEIIEATFNRAKEEDRDLDEVENANVIALDLEINKLDARIQQVAEIETRKQAANELAKRVEVSTPETRQAGGWKVTSEEPTYHARGVNSFLADAISSEFNNNYEAAERINRYNREITLEKRDVGTANFAGLVVPQYLIDLYANLGSRWTSGRGYLPKARSPGSRYDGQHLKGNDRNSRRLSSRRERYSDGN
jgi:hypothetical protein